MEDNYIANIGNRSVFSFYNINLPFLTECIRLGCGGNILEIDVVRNNKSIKSCTCILCYNLSEKKLNLPQTSSLKEKNEISFTKNNRNNSIDFRALYDNDDLNVILGDVSSIISYYKSNRMVFYYDDSNSLVAFKIKDLTKEEFDFLKREELHPGSYMNSKVMNENYKNDIINYGFDDLLYLNNDDLVNYLYKYDKNQNDISVDKNEWFDRNKDIIYIDEIENENDKEGYYGRGK